VDVYKSFLKVLNSCKEPKGDDCIICGSSKSKATGDYVVTITVESGKCNVEGTISVECSDCGQVHTVVYEDQS